SMMTRVSGRELMLVNPTFTTHRLTQWCMKRCSVQRETKRLRKHLITLKLQHITRVSRSLASLHGCLGGDNYGQHRSEERRVGKECRARRATWSERRTEQKQM